MDACDDDDYEYSDIEFDDNECRDNCEYDSSDKSDDNDHIQTDIMKKLTLELMVNKKHYKKITEKTDNQKFQEIEEYSKMISKTYPEIIKMTEGLLANYIDYGSSENFNQDIRSSFEHYLSTCLDHIITVSNNRKNENDYYHKETDIIFESCDETSSYVPTNVPNFWGKPIKKSL